MSSFSNYTTKSIDAVFKELGITDSGLSEFEAKKRQEKYGRNEINTREISWWQILFRQFRSSFNYLLCIAAVIAAILGETLDAIIILVIIALSIGLSFKEDYHSEKTLKLLRKRVVGRARVIRDGKEKLLPNTELVVGDIVILTTGDIVSADMRIISENSLTVDEEVLTGESAPAQKIIGILAEPATEIHKAKNILLAGSKIVSGQARGIVFSIARNTLMGEISHLAIATERESIFERNIKKFSQFILKLILGTLFILLVVHLIIQRETPSIPELLIFLIALAVSAIPEALPVVTTVSLARGAMQLAKRDVLVKRLSAVEDLGSIEVLCTDKTGTLTENILKVVDIRGRDTASVVQAAALASSFLGDHSREPNNAFDLAIWEKLSANEQENISSIERMRELPFDPERKRNSVIVRKGINYELIVRGAPEMVIDLCEKETMPEHEDDKAWMREEGGQGHRLIAVARKVVENVNQYTDHDESGLEFLGIIAFQDPLKSSTREAVRDAKNLGVEIKILTGDSAEVAGSIGFAVGLLDDPEHVMTGAVLDALSHEARHEAIRRQRVFARVSPRQKYEIIKDLENQNLEVGFLGEGINDAPALKIADVGLVVDSAADIAREVADILLLNHSLRTIIDGIREGRRVFANTTKYIKATLTSNFGNFYAVALASLLVDFLPMLPLQILLVNFLSDFPMIAISTDNVDPDELRRPRAYNIREIVFVATVLGAVSTVFDFIFFAVFVRQGADVLRTHWFVGSILTELVLIASIRTRKPFFKAIPLSRLLRWLSGIAAVITIVLPFTFFGQQFFKFTMPSVDTFLLTLGIVVAYFIVTEVVKLLYYRQVREPVNM